MISSSIQFIPRSFPAAAPAQQHEHKAARIMALILRYANSFGPAEAGVSEYLSRHKQKILRSCELNETLELVLPAFPAKSPNREKTLGPLPDFAEVLGLERLQNICEEISAIHAPGARLVICSDGRVFSDLVLVDDCEVSTYGNAIRDIIRDLGLTRLSTFSMEDAFSGQNFDAMRAGLVQEFGRSVGDIRADILLNSESRMMFNGIHRFIFEDRVILEAGKSRNRLREEAKDVAYRVIQRSNAWSALVERLFPHALRLSIHPQFPESAKIGFQLVPCENIWGTPWHNVALLGPGGFRLVKRKEAEDLGATINHAHGKYAYFKEPVL